MKAAFLASAVLATASVVFYFGTVADTAKASGPQPAAGQTLASRSLSMSSSELQAKTMSLPMFFEPNQGQTAPQVKFLARGAGYGLFLTADEAVLELRPSAASHQPSEPGSQVSGPRSQASASSVVRMRLAGASASPRVSGASPLPGKSSYYIGNDPAKWHRDIPQFARVEYSGVYPGVDLVYYGNQGQLEYDFRVAPAADPSQIALSFDGASAHIDSGDLVLSTSSGDVRFHAPVIYQRDGNTQKPVAGGFRQLADNKIGFTVGPYDHSRELVIDPVLSYSTYLGAGGESVAYVAVGPDGYVYLAGSTSSANFPVLNPYQSWPGGALNIFIAELSPDLNTLLYATYLGGSGTDTAAGIGVGTAEGGTGGSQLEGFDVYVAGSTSSPNFPTSTGGNFTIPPFQSTLPTGTGAGTTHGFVTRLNICINTEECTTTSTLYYSTYLAGTNAAENATDTITGLAIDGNGNAFVTGVTTSTNPQTAAAPFPASPNGYQTISNAPSQFFVSEIDTKLPGTSSIVYSTYFGGGNPQTGQAVGGGIAVDSVPNIYFTGGTNFLGVTGPAGPTFPLYNAQQTCLNQAGLTSGCSNTNTNLDAFVAKISPTYSGLQSLVYSTFLGGSGNDVGNAIAVDTSSNAYVTGSTNSDDWNCGSCTGFESNTYVTAGATNAFVAKIGGLSGSTYPLGYFTYLGGSGYDVGKAIVVDTQQAVRVTGSTSSSDLPFFPNDPLCPSPLTCSYNGQTYGGLGDAFVALIGTTLTGQGAGDYLTYLGGSAFDQGTGIALANDGTGSTYVAGVTQSTNFPVVSPYQGSLVGTQYTPQDAFVSKLGPYSALYIPQQTSSSPSPSTVAAGVSTTFTFNIYNYGPDNAVNVQFNATVAVLPTSPNGLSSTTANVSGGGGNCNSATGQGTYISCYIPTLAASTTSYATVTVTVTASPTATPPAQSITVSPYVGANGVAPTPQTNAIQTATVDDFQIQAEPSPIYVTAGTPASIQVLFSPAASSTSYSGTITPSQTTSPAMVTSPSPTFNPTSVTMSGSGYQTTTLTIATVAPPITTSSLFRRGSFYAAWLPIGGLGLVGLGFGAGRKRRRWLVPLALFFIAGAILLQPACSGKSTPNPTSGGTQSGWYTVTITGSAGSGAVHTAKVSVYVY